MPSPSSPEVYREREERLSRPLFPPDVHSMAPGLAECKWFA
jgi:hypothetical protein